MQHDDTSPRRSNCWVFSGLGADHRLYQAIDWRPVEAAGWTIRPVDWRAIGPARDMADFVRRALALGIADGDLLIGSSFGGMLVASMQERLPNSPAVLLGSASHPREFNRLGDLVLPLLQPELLRSLQWLAWPLVVLSHPRRVAVRMFRDSDVRIMARMLRTLLSWPGAPPSRRRRRLHGRYDPLIRWRRGRERVTLLSATHLTSLEKPRAVGRWLAEQMFEVSRRVGTLSASHGDSRR